MLSLTTYPIYWISYSDQSKDRPSCWRKCFYIEYDSKQTSDQLEKNCLMEASYDRYDDPGGAFSVIPAAACTEDSSMDDFRLDLEHMVKVTGDWRPGKILRTFSESNHEYVTIKGRKVVFVGVDAKLTTCQNIKIGTPVFYHSQGADHFGGIVSSFELKGGICTCKVNLFGRLPYNDNG
jgi:hypothetical protein